MISKSEWQDIHDAMTAGDRARLGEPPTADELLALDRGELSEADAERVRDGLIAYPDLARAYAAEFTNGVESLSEAEVDRQWKRFTGARPDAGGGKLLFWRAATAIAATLAIAFSLLLWQTQSVMRRPRIVGDEITLMPDGHRGVGGEATAITPRGDAYLLLVTIVGQSVYRNYQLDIVDAAQKPVWSIGSLQRNANDSFDVEVPVKFLAPGRYQVIIYGFHDSTREKVATYTIDVR